MNPMAVALGVQAVGSILGGSSRNRSAKAVAREMGVKTQQVMDLADHALAVSVEDQARALQYRADDEARLKAATGYDLVKLRADAKAAGFNPLSVLTLTGGAGYDGRGAVLSSPFMGRASYLSDKAGLLSGMSGLTQSAGQAVVETSGYFGDAVAGIGKGMFDLGAMDAQMRHERMIQQAAITGASTARAAGGGVVRGRPGRSAPLVDAIVATASPVSMGPAAEGNGAPTYLDPDRRQSVRPQDNISGGMTIDNRLTDWIGGGVVVPGSDGEIMSPSELLVAGTWIVGTGAVRVADWALKRAAGTAFGGGGVQVGPRRRAPAVVAPYVNVTVPPRRGAVPGRIGVPQTRQPR